MMLQRLCRRLPAVSCACRAIHTTEDCQKQDIGVYREARMIKKLMTGSNRPRKKFFNVDQTPAKQFAELKFLEHRGTPEKRTYSNRSKHRVKVLNVLFVEQITSLLSTGEVGTEILELGLNVTRVKISPDFSCVNVYWKPDGTEKDEILEKELRKAGGMLRHQLSQLRVIGIVPPIYFVKDPVEDRLTQIEQALSKCDFGEDHVPVDLGTAVKAMKPVPVNSSGKLNLQLEGEEVSEGESSVRSRKKKEKLMEEAILNQSLEEILEGPPMRHDILGLDRASIMEKILNASQRTKRPKEEYIPLISVAPEDTDSMEKDVMALRDNTDRKKEFLKFLAEKRKSKTREAKRNSTDAKEKEFLEVLREERLLREYEAMFAHEEEEREDFVEVHDSVKYP